MRGWWQEIAGLVLPVSCEGCGRPRTALCPACAHALTGEGPRRVRPSPEPGGLPATYAAVPYEGAVRTLLLAHKERGALPLAGPLGAALAGAVTAAAGPVEPFGTGPCLLVPVPSSRRSVRARGHDPTRRLAMAAAGRLRRAGRAARVLPVLRQRRAVADQAGLGAAERRANLSGALTLAPGGAGPLAEAVRTGGRVVLVDDLMTTGTTLAEAARALAAVCSAGYSVHPPFTIHGFPGSPEEATPHPLFERLTAAVLASSPASFELNRNSSRTRDVAGGEW
ncbi:phosphoribosyltransferase family protein [Streptomyces sp. NPDC048717]|uniref:ComF family protein n=1 Tax=Streptomyces sp. NPDC048717 TaxID=3154928 RepID=UPI003423B296